MNDYKELKTPFEEDLTSSPYPRPQLKRDSFLSLSGEWDLYVRGEREEYLGKIIVPYPPESRISGICRELKPSESYIYRKSFFVENDFFVSRTLLHFGAVDQRARVTLNGVTYPDNVGGYLPFTYDVTDSVRVGENTLEVEVTDTLDKTLGYGKQTRKSSGMWYTAISGIWQEVWLESVADRYIKSVSFTPTLDSVDITVDGGLCEKTLLFDGREYAFEGDSFTLEIESPICWTPENPHLYSIVITDGVDRVESYFALRTVDIREIKGRMRLCLNGKPYFFHGLLDQGYWSDGIFTPASDKGYLFDILEMKKQGFNTLRKHIKIEPDIFYYYCDKYGMAVFQDMVNSGEYSFIRDTALPTLGFKKAVREGAEKKRLEAFLSDSIDTLSLLYNHPSVVYYTIFNEGWGQFDADGVYEVLKRLDPTRIFDTASGWFKPCVSDVDSEHIYFKKIKLKCCKRPLVLSEFGGYSCRIDSHVFNESKTYGYGKCRDTEELTRRLEDVYLKEIIPLIDEGLSASILTQLSDIEDEINGLVTYDRQVVKTDALRMKAIADEINKHIKALQGE
ncbi:MAG: glycoside hydrolase family 2 [Clostridia bacterium]|nr:glycoside hydrolase family 2 [Clostridia bacterium]